MQVSKIITSALKQLGVLAAGENASGEEVADAMDSLKDIIGQWATHKLYVYKAHDIEIPLVKGANTYLVGKVCDDPCGYAVSCCGSVVVTPDINAEIAFIADIAMLDDNQIIMVRNNNGSRASDICYQVDFPNWSFVVNCNDRKILTVKAYTLASNLCPHDELHLPLQYERALKLTLAMEIAPMFGVEPSNTLLVNQRNAVNLLKRSNVTPLYVKNTLNIGVGRCGCH